MKLLTLFRHEQQVLDEPTRARIDRAILYGSLQTGLSDVLALVLLATSAGLLSGASLPGRGDMGLLVNSGETRTIALVLVGLAGLRILPIIPTLIGIAVVTLKIRRLTRTRT